MVRAPPLAMLHVVAHAVHGDFLWRSHEEGLALWNRLLVLRPSSLCLMPDHVHLMSEHYEHPRFARVLSGYARWRHHHRGGGSGAVWLPHPPPRRPAGRLHLRRTYRYIALNPCRDGLVDDPLAWPWSSYRDAVGLAVSPVIRPVRDPIGLHSYVSADGAVAAEGTALPAPRADVGRPWWGALVAAVSALCRVPAARLAEPGHARQLLVAAARELGGMSAVAVARRLGVSRSTVHREAPVRAELLELVARVVDEPRFPALGSGWLDRRPRWQDYLRGQSLRRRRKDWMYD
jgi:hypothetical protein